MNTLAEVAHQRFEKYHGEISCLFLVWAKIIKAKECLEGELVDATALGKELRDSLNKEVASSSKFLKSKVGKINLEFIKADFKGEFEASGEFEWVALAKTDELYEQTIHDCGLSLELAGASQAKISCF